MELIKDVVDKRENPHTMQDPWSVTNYFARRDAEYRSFVRQWIQQAHERGQDDLHIQQD